LESYLKVIKLKPDHKTASSNYEKLKKAMEDKVNNEKK